MGTSQRRQPRVLVSAASGHGSTTEIARVIGGTLADRGFAVDIIPPVKVDSIDDYDAVILGSAVYAGHWLTPAQDFAIRFRDGLPSRAVWLFSSGPVGDPARKLVKSMAADPAGIPRTCADIGARGHHMFAGKLDPDVLSRPQRAALLLLRGMRGDFRDWTEVAQWADMIAKQLTAESHSLGS